VLIEEQPTELLLRVEDDGRGRAGGLSGGGNGLPGMRARAAALGGVLSAGARSGGGYTVRARLPLEETGGDRDEHAGPDKDDREERRPDAARATIEAERGVTA
jgi:signal transduction histidine kinase